ncbi:cytoplasmic tRNA 2-thiolation protein 2 [Venturia canescens]|uniref:cytoplasmic tRNA 2-thiolation protein 2 n=1 Tax=Venturia canescens TaxID=32260 RepID=UPI001C9C8645|nr:cytoplasmic tRNA 2-thiolation protein 2 [Venturia canescens]
MCSINEENDEALEFIPEEKYQLLDNALCQKCKVEQALVVLRGKDVYCNTCFLLSATHKFRATLGKSKIVRPSDKILVAHSGKSGSTVLLHLIKAGMHESVHKRLVFETKIVYIDEGAIDGQNCEERSAKIEAIKEQIAYLGFQCFAQTLSQSLINDMPRTFKLETLSSSLENFTNEDERLREILSKLPNRTSKLELIKKLRKKLIFNAARNLNCNKIFLADDSTSLAIDILSNVSLGRGAQLSLDVGFLDDRFCDVSILRPMRDFSRHELQTYLKIHDLKILCENGNPKLKTLNSIQELTEKFVTDLDSQFNGTVSTVFRTGEKVCSISNKNRSDDENCALCDAPLDTKASEDVISAIQATSFSKLLSSQGPEGNIRGNQQILENLSSKESEKLEKCENCSGTCAKNSELSLTLETLTKFLCYGCRLIFRSSDIQDVPRSILDIVRQKVSLESMREEITDFLL